MAARTHPGGGRKPRGEAPATLVLTVRLTPVEMARLDNARQATSRAEWVRARLALDSLPDPLTPEAVSAYVSGRG